MRRGGFDPAVHSPCVDRRTPRISELRGIDGELVLLPSVCAYGANCATRLPPGLRPAELGGTPRAREGALRTERDPHWRQHWLRLWGDEPRATPVRGPSAARRSPPPPGEGQAALGSRARRTPRPPSPPSSVVAVEDFLLTEV